ncbi:MAG TPA: class I SAM-dependent methyltransferase [Terriglobia bacterium]|nr:class I SAM-dependent methyltransferase [Terriglobia bacterium]
MVTTKMTANVGIGAQDERKEKVSFSFGRNWQDFLEKHLTPGREQRALQSICEFLEVEDLKDRSFLDIGCGSGLFSLAAHRLGAQSIFSLDVDPFSVQCCQELKRRAGNPQNWTVEEGSILDATLLDHLPSADIVYAWGSLHHTGNMWQAIRNAASRVKKGGLFYVTIYNRVEGRKGSEFWLRVKKRYNSSSTLVKRSMEWAYMLRFGLLSSLASFKSPAKFVRDYGRERGMSYWTDVRDWLGGYPYEFASVHEMFRFCTRELGMEMVNLRATNTTGTNDFLFRKRD